jgi:hypothetical protein
MSGQQGAAHRQRDRVQAVVIAYERGLIRPGGA